MCTFLAQYTHCHAHSLSLSVKDVTNNIKMFHKVMGVAEKIVILIKYCPNVRTYLGRIRNGRLDTQAFLKQIECKGGVLPKNSG